MEQNIKETPTQFFFNGNDFIVISATRGSELCCDREKIRCFNIRYLVIKWKLWNSAFYLLHCKIFRNARFIYRVSYKLSFINQIRSLLDAITSNDDSDRPKINTLELNNTSHTSILWMLLYLLKWDYFAIKLFYI